MRRQIVVIQSEDAVGSALEVDSEQVVRQVEATFHSRDDLVAP